MLRSDQLPGFTTRRKLKDRSRPCASECLVRPFPPSITSLSRRIIFTKVRNQSKKDRLDDSTANVENTERKDEKVCRPQPPFRNDLHWALLGGSVRHLTSAQVMISQLMGSSPASGSVLTVHNLEAASDAVSPSLRPLPCSHSVSLSFKNKQTFKNRMFF